ncbi:hypothetical protein AAHE18_10G048200 [Arachis hypogaea]
MASQQLLRRKLQSHFHLQFVLSCLNICFTKAYIEKGLRQKVETKPRGAHATENGHRLSDHKIRKNSQLLIMNSINYPTIIFMFPIQESVPRSTSTPWGVIILEIHLRTKKKSWSGGYIMYSFQLTLKQIIVPCY